MEKMLASVSSFIDELQKQIVLFENLEPKSDYFESDYNLLANMFNKHGLDIQNLTINDLVQLDNDEAELLLSKVGIDRREIIHYIYNFSIEKQKHLKGDYSSNQYFNEVLNLIKNFVDDYNEISANRDGLKNNKVELYKKYLEMFGNDFEEVFEDLDELKKVMSSMAISTYDQWQIIKYVTGKNINIAETKEKDINLVKEVTEYISDNLDPEDEDVMVIESQVNKKELDVDLLPMIAKNLFDTLNIPENKCLGILSSLILSGALTEYKELLCEDIININRVSELREIMKTILKNRVDIKDDIINEAMRIVSENCDFMKENQDADAKTLVTETISEIQKDDMSYDEAVKLKTIPIIKSMSETLDSLNNPELSAEDYILCCDLLEELINAYNNIISKQEIKRVI